MLRQGMLYNLKWKYMIHFQNQEYNEFIEKEIIENLYEELEPISDYAGSVE